MWGGSYLIHSPWVLPTLLGDYFTADGEGGGGRGDETCRLYRARSKIYTTDLCIRETRARRFLRALSLVQILFNEL